MYFLLALNEYWDVVANAFSLHFLEEKNQNLHLLLKMLRNGCALSMQICGALLHN